MDLLRLLPAAFPLRRPTLLRAGPLAGPGSVFCSASKGKGGRPLPCGAVDGTPHPIIIIKRWCVTGAVRRPRGVPAMRFPVVLLVTCAVLNAQGATLGPSTAPVPVAYFGLNVESPDASEMRPPAPAWRLWDAGVGWRAVEPQKGQWDFSRLDAFVNRASQSGAQILYVFGMTPQWAAANPNDPGNYNAPGMASPPQEMADWENYVRTLAQRYKGRI
jgi:hypothetical protein